MLPHPLLCTLQWLTLHIATFFYYDYLLMFLFRFLCGPFLQASSHHAQLLSIHLPLRKQVNAKRRIISL